MFSNVEVRANSLGAFGDGGVPARLQRAGVWPASQVRVSRGAASSVCAAGIVRGSVCVRVEYAAVLRGLIERGKE